MAGMLFLENLLSMKILHWTGVIAACALVVGCERADTGGTADDGYNRSTSAGASAEARLNSLTNQPDNTALNVRDRDDATLTPGDQGTTESDREITRKIRKALNAEPQLSTTAKNIKIITVNGKVTLRGPVTTAQERTLIETTVKNLGVGTLDNQIEAKTTTQ